MSDVAETATGKVAAPPPPPPPPTLSPAPTETANPQRPTKQPRRRTSTTRTYRTRATCPDPGSLYDVLRENCGRSLFVLPILWTDVHARLLRTDFVAQPPIVSPVPVQSAAAAVQSAAPPESCSNEHGLRYDLGMLLSAHDMRPFSKSRAIKSVLSSLFATPFSRPKSNTDLDLYFGGRGYRKAVRVPVLWSSPGGTSTSFDSAVTHAVSSFGQTAAAAASSDVNNNNSSSANSNNSSQSSLDGPTVAYVNRSHLAMIRQNLFRIVPGPEDGDVGNTPVSRLQCLRSKQLRPTEPDRDPYLMGVFLGMAQAHFYDSAASRAASQVLWWSSSRSKAQQRQQQQRNHSRVVAPVTAFHNVKLRIVTHDDDTSDFIVYTTTVTADMLKRFDEPTKNADADADADDNGPAMTIDFVRVPVWPLAGLRARLGKALGADLVGDLTDEATPAPTPDDATVTDSPSGSQAMDQSDTAAAAAAAAAPTTADEQQRGSRVDSLKRKRGERRSLSDVFHGGSSTTSSSTAKDDDSKEAPSPPGTPPKSPRTKRRRTRSLSSSLAVF